MYLMFSAVQSDVFSCLDKEKAIKTNSKIQLQRTILLHKTDAGVCFCVYFSCKHSLPRMHLLSRSMYLMFRFPDCLIPVAEDKSKVYLQRISLA